MANLPPKQVLKDELLSVLKNTLETIERAHEAAQEAATHEEARPENDKDTRGLEQSYLARGQAMRVSQLRLAVAAVESMPVRPFGEEQPISMGALVLAHEETQQETRETAFFLTPGGGGTMLANGRVQAVTPGSPLGQELQGKTAGDECEVLLEGRIRILSLDEVR